MRKDITDKTANADNNKMEAKNEGCNDCLKSLQLLVDGEINKDQENYLRTHLDDCIPCYKVYNVEKAVKEILQNKLEKKPVPTHLINLIIDKIRQTA